MNDRVTHILTAIEQDDLDTALRSIQVNLYDLVADACLSVRWMQHEQRIPPELDRTIAQLVDTLTQGLTYVDLLAHARERLFPDAQP